MLEAPSDKAGGFDDATLSLNEIPLSHAVK